MVKLYLALYETVKVFSKEIASFLAAMNECSYCSASLPAFGFFFLSLVGML